MPSGYTSKLYEKGQSLGDFVLECAKAFFWAFKEAPANADWDETLKDYFEPDIKRKQRYVREQELRLSEANEMRLSDARKILKEQYERALREQQENKPKYDERLARFTKMRDDVLALPWDEKDDLHKNLRKFMLGQLAYDIPADGKHYYSEPPKLYDDDDAADYIARERENAESCLAQAHKDLAELRREYENQKKALRKLRELMKDIPTFRAGRKVDLENT